jgi:anti-sigma factor (TIGR02949 family)
MTKHEIDCKQALDQLFEFIDQELPDDRRDAMQHHLHTCKSCYSRFEFERRLKEKLGGMGKGEPSSGISDRITKLLSRL